MIGLSRFLMTGHEHKCGGYRQQVSADDSRDIDIGPPLTEGGGDSDVYKALRKNDGKLLAVKEVEILITAAGMKGILELVQETQILNNTKHKNIVRYRDWSVQNEEVVGQTVMKLYLYSDFLRHDTLETRYKEFGLSERQIGLYTRHILSGIAYLHGKNILHRDIRCGNIWVDDEAVCKLANFGKAKELRYRKARDRSVSGHEHWMAPEFASGEGYETPVDIWSLGCTILEMLTGQKPFEADGVEVKEFEVVQLLKAGKGPTLPEYRYIMIRNDLTKVKITPTARDFVEMCLQVQPGRRPTANYLLRHLFVNPPTQPRASRIVPFPSEEEFERVSMASEEQQKEAVESQYQDACVRHDDLSVKQMCLRISKELEKNGSDSSVIIISNDWLIKWQSDDDKVYAKLLDFGYMKTFETETYSCFENFLDPSDGGCNCCDDVQSIRDVLPKHLVSHGTPQWSGRYKDSPSLVVHDTSSTSGTDMQDGVYVDDHGTRKSLEEAGASGEENVLTATEVHDSKVSSMCLGDCPHIPLSVVKHSNDCGATSSSISATPVALTVLKLESKDALFKVPLALSCCVNEDHLCIKLSCLKGEIFPSGSAGTFRLRQTRLSITAKVDHEIILLRPLDPENDGRRVCSKGKAQWEYKHGKHGKTVWAKIAPAFQSPLIGGSLGEAGVYRNDDKVPVTICGRMESLDLVVLKVSHQGCSSFDFQKVLVLERDIANTYLAREHGDVTCMDSQADSRPVVLMGNFHLDSSSSGDRHRLRSVEITCCAELEIDFIPDEMGIVEIIEKERMKRVDRKHKRVSLCHGPGTGHVTFKGMARTNT